MCNISKYEQVVILFDLFVQFCFNFLFLQFCTSYPVSLILKFDSGKFDSGACIAQYQNTVSICACGVNSKRLGTCGVYGLRAACTACVRRVRRVPGLLAAHLKLACCLPLHPSSQCLCTLHPDFW